MAERPSGSYLYWYSRVLYNPTRPSLADSLDMEQISVIVRKRVRSSTGGGRGNGRENSPCQLPPAKITRTTRESHTPLVTEGPVPGEEERLLLWHCTDVVLLQGHIFGSPNDCVASSSS